MLTIKDFKNPPHAIPLAELGDFFSQREKSPPESSTKELERWQMEDNDAPIFKFLYQAHQPRRHLEFGTWQGWGTTLCLETCDATVWTLNLLEGEVKPDGSWAYGERILDDTNVPRDIIAESFGSDEKGEIIYHRTDAGGYIGRIYKEKGLGNRVCQTYCDSRDWDISNYPSDFFDSILIDGGHEPDVVVSDTRKALQVLRPGGLLMWHDFCPLADVRSKSVTVKGVTAGIEIVLPELQSKLESLCWIDPSWILMGVKK